MGLGIERIFYDRVSFEASRFRQSRERISGFVPSPHSYREQLKPFSRIKSGFVRFVLTSAIWMGTSLLLQHGVKFIGRGLAAEFRKSKIFKGTLFGAFLQLRLHTTEFAIGNRSNSNKFH